MVPAPAYDHRRGIPRRARRGRRGRTPPRGQAGAPGPSGPPGAPGAASKGPSQGGPVAVAVATASSGDIRVRVPALGTITPLASVTVRTQVAGQLQKIAFTEGQQVRQGDFLVQIDPRPYESALEQARGNLSATRRCWSMQARPRALRGPGRGGRYRRPAARHAARWSTSTRHRRGGPGRGATAEVNLAYTHIVSPVRAGSDCARSIRATTYAGRRQRHRHRQPARADHRRSSGSGGQPGASCSGCTPARPAVEGLRSQHCATRRPARSRARQPDRPHRHGQVRAQFDNADGALFPNQFVNIRLLVDTLKNQVVVPTPPCCAALQRRATSSTSSNCRPHRRGATGRRSASSTASRSRSLGLAAGDIVVTEGGDRLSDGAKIAASARRKPARGAARPGGRSRRRSWQAPAPRTERRTPPRPAAMNPPASSSCGRWRPRC